MYILNWSKDTQHNVWKSSVNIIKLNCFISFTQQQFEFINKPHVVFSRHRRRGGGETRETDREKKKVGCVFDHRGVCSESDINACKHAGYTHTTHTHTRRSLHLSRDWHGGQGEVGGQMGLDRKPLIGRASVYVSVRKRTLTEAKHSQDKHTPPPLHTHFKVRV